METVTLLIIVNIKYFKAMIFILFGDVCIPSLVIPQPVTDKKWIISFNKKEILLLNTSILFLDLQLLFLQSKKQDGGLKKDLYSISENWCTLPTNHRSKNDNSLLSPVTQPRKPTRNSFFFSWRHAGIMFSLGSIAWLNFKRARSFSKETDSN